MIALAELLCDLVGITARFALWVAIVNIFAQPKSLIWWISSLWAVVRVWSVDFKQVALKIMRSVRFNAQAVVITVIFGISAFVIIGAPGTAINGKVLSNCPLGSRNVIRRMNNQQFISSDRRIEKPSSGKPPKIKKRSDL